MKKTYTDLYALFRHDRNAEEYFNELPSFVQDQIGARYKSIDSFDRLLSYVQQFHYQRM